MIRRSWCKSLTAASTKSAGVRGMGTKVAGAAGKPLCQQGGGRGTLAGVAGDSWKSFLEGHGGQHGVRHLGASRLGELGGSVAASRALRTVSKDGLRTAWHKAGGEAAGKAGVVSCSASSSSGCPWRDGAGHRQTCGRFAASLEPPGAVPVSVLSAFLPIEAPSALPEAAAAFVSITAPGRWQCSLLSRKEG